MRAATRQQFNAHRQGAKAHCRQPTHFNTRLDRSNWSVAKVVKSILKRLGKVNKFRQFVPRTLTKTNKWQRCCACTKSLALLERDGGFLERATADDECWLYAYEERASGLSAIVMATT